MREFTEADIDRLSRIQRVNVIGTSGSGKSTFGRRLAAALDLPYVEMDQVYWRPDWQEPSDDEYFRAVRAITNQPKWVLDGNYTRTTHVKWNHVQLVVWLDMSFPRTIFQITKRSLQRALCGAEIWPGTGNRESIRRSFFSTDSVILWAITSYRRNKRRYGNVAKSPENEGIWFIRLRGPAQVDRFLQMARQAAQAV